MRTDMATLQAGTDWPVQIPAPVTDLRTLALS